MGKDRYRYWICCLIIYVITQTPYAHGKANTGIPIFAPETEKKSHKKVKRKLTKTKQAFSAND